MAVLAPEPMSTTTRYQKGAYVDPQKNPSYMLPQPGAVLIYPERSSPESDCPQLTDQSNAMSHTICPNLGWHVPISALYILMRTAPAAPRCFDEAGSLRHTVHHCETSMMRGGTTP